jgi:hypothetical protein
MPIYCSEWGGMGNDQPPPHHLQQPDQVAPLEPQSEEYRDLEYLPTSATDCHF